MISKFKLNTPPSVETKEAISRTLEIANKYAGELSIEILSLDKIELDPENNRDLALTLHDAINGINPEDEEYEKKKKDWKSLESLAKTIAEDQLINPIYVYRYGNKCRLIAGERRTLASAIAGKKEIIARIASQRPIGTKLKVLQWIENNERIDLTLAERVSNLEAIIKEHLNENKEENSKERITAKQLSDLTGLSNTQSRRYLLILQASPAIKRAITEGKLENIKLVEFICSVENNEHQNKILDAALSGLTFEALVNLKKELETEIDQGNRRIKRGRKKENISLGRIKPDVAKIIVDALISSRILSGGTLEKMNSIKEGIKWGNSESIEKSFKKIMAILEKGI